MLTIKSEEFSLEVEELVSKTQDGYLDAILEVCLKHGMEPEFAASLLSKSIIEKLHSEGVNLNILPKTSKLPV
tara:strand:+ start:185 stop:403 length:219 start_codon:yes stop_codon:yes gene_type:complete